MYAASSYWLSNFSNIGWTALTTKGIPTKINAIIIPMWVYEIFIPNFAKYLPTIPVSEYIFESVIPATAVGKAKGNSNIPSKNLFPKKSYFTSTHAKTTPKIQFIMAATNEQPTLVKSAIKTAFSVISCQNSEGDNRKE